MKRSRWSGASLLAAQRPERSAIWDSFGPKSRFFSMVEIREWPYGLCCAISDKAAPRCTARRARWPGSGVRPASGARDV
eukprot:1913342-Prymnesium_polylepis.1